VSGIGEIVAAFAGICGNLRSNGRLAIAPV
jgi:hypothetical protein